MEYIVHRRLRGNTLCGVVNLPFGTVCELRGEIIYAKDKPLVICTSEKAHQFFARNDDGKGIERGHLTQEILTVLHPIDIGEGATRKQIAKAQEYEKFRERAWMRIDGDPALKKFKRVEIEDDWIWNHDFYNAEISDLQYQSKEARRSD